MTDYFRKEVGEGHPLERLRHLMLKMGEFNQTEDASGTQPNSVHEKTRRKQTHLDHQLGYVDSQKGEYKAALLHYDQVVKTALANLSENDSSLARTYNNMASVYYSMGGYTSALAFYKKSLEIEKKSLSSNHPTLATTYNNIGSVHSSMDDYSKARIL